MTRILFALALAASGAALAEEDAGTPQRPAEQQAATPADDHGHEVHEGHPEAGHEKKEEHHEAAQPAEKGVPKGETAHPAEEPKPADDKPQPAEKGVLKGETAHPAEEPKPADDKPQPAEKGVLKGETAHPAEEPKPADDKPQPAEKGVLKGETAHSPGGIAAEMAAESMKKHEVPPEVKKIVDHFTGSWSFTTTISMAEGMPPIKAREKYQCKKIANGAAVNCHGSGKVPGMGKMEATHLIGYDPELKVVRMLSWSSMGEIHDHRGAYKDDDHIEVGVETTMMGKKVTKVLDFFFPKKNQMEVKAVTTFEDGSKSTFEAKGKRTGK